MQAAPADSRVGREDAVHEIIPAATAGAGTTRANQRIAVGRLIPGKTKATGIGPVPSKVILAGNRPQTPASELHKPVLGRYGHPYKWARETGLHADFQTVVLADVFKQALTGIFY